MCQRHVRVAEVSCPFCGVELLAELAERAVPGTTQRLGRAATFVFGAAIAASGCARAVTPAGSDAAAVEDHATPAPDAVDAVDTVDTIGPSDCGTIVALYGAGPPPCRDGGR
jgi:hypothetical protein